MQKRAEVLNGIDQFEENLQDFTGVPRKYVDDDNDPEEEGVEGGDDLMRDTTMVKDEYGLMASLKERVPHP